MNQPAKAQEPSMEEILASIRRIIADDDTAKPAAAKAESKPEAKPEAKPAPVAVAPAPAPAPAAPAKAPDASNSQDDIDALFASFDSTPEPEEEPPPPPPEPEPVAVAPPPPPPPPAPAAPPVARAPADDVLELTESMRTAPPGLRKVDGRPDVVFSERAGWDEAPPRPVEDGRPLLSATTSAAVDSAFNTLAHTVLVQNARTLEDLVREMLRPMLKAWLDDNLPQMVERLVRAEIERVSRGRT
ncbi:PopZ family protein [Rhodoplanes azumiensis]|uniref:PopZ family protein n=1 Tax=Rhodoplanes azumiensis TaxID=1897628 RepID=A0ABW5AFF4_9BRAD